jgi:hypothetical protein
MLHLVGYILEWQFIVDTISVASTRHYSGVISGIMNVHKVLFGHIILASRLGILGVPINDLTFKSDAQRKLIAYNSEILSSVTGVPVRTHVGKTDLVYSSVAFCYFILN